MLANLRPSQLHLPSAGDAGPGAWAGADAGPSPRAGRPPKGAHIFPSSTAPRAGKIKKCGGRRKKAPPVCGVRRRGDFARSRSTAQQWPPKHQQQDERRLHCCSTAGFLPVLLPASEGRLWASSGRSRGRRCKVPVFTTGKRLNEKKNTIIFFNIFRKYICTCFFHKS